MANIPKTDPLFATRWVHMYEEDGAEGSVYRPDSADIPLSRRPRDGLELAADGTGRLLLPGPADRHEAVPARWRQERDDIVIRTEAGVRGPARELRIVARKSDRLLVRS